MSEITLTEQIEFAHSLAPHYQGDTHNRDVCNAIGASLVELAGRRGWSPNSSETQIAAPADDAELERLAKWLEGLGLNSKDCWEAQDRIAAILRSKAPERKEVPIR